MSRRLPTPLSFRLLDWGLVPDPVLRLACRARVWNRLREERAGSVEERSDRFRALVEDLRKSAVTTHTAEANAQHYEVPPEFFGNVLGPKVKYSSCYWPDGVTTLAAAEDAMLDLYAERAGLTDGQRILEMGCGWGSFCLWAAERFPATEIVAVSNSGPQRRYIQGQAAARGLVNLTVITADIAEFDPAAHDQVRPFDRIVSIEMLEHVRNHEELFGRVARWLAPDGRCFVHVFAARDVCFRYDADDPGDWMGRYFFSGGIMPSDELFLHHQADLVCVDHWRLSGRHYARTADAWIRNLDARHADVIAALAPDVGQRQARLWARRWKAFFVGCSELWGYGGGEDFGVSHYLFAPRRSA